jgi:hypothetical protein
MWIVDLIIEFVVGTCVLMMFMTEVIDYIIDFLLIIVAKIALWFCWAGSNSCSNISSKLQTFNF